MMGHRERMISGDEVDCFTGWRRVLCVFRKPRVARKTKARFNRRVRKQAGVTTKAEAKQSLYDRLQVARAGEDKAELAAAKRAYFGQTFDDAEQAAISNG